MNGETATKKILMVDDDNDLREVLGMYLELEGYEVFHAQNGQVGQEQLKKLTPDLITLDMMMPVLDGMVFLSWLRQEMKLDIPVIALTGRAKDDTKNKVEELGVSDLLFKPFEPDALVARIKEILG